MGLLDEELLPFFGNPNIQRQGARARALAAQRDVNTLPDPRTYAAVSGLLGQAPDEMGFSVLNPQYESIQRTAKPAFALGTLLGLAPMTKGLPVGASIKNVGKSSITKEGNPIQGAVVLVGDKMFIGRTHGDALNRAIYEGVVRKEGGKYIFPKGAEVNSDLFITKDGQIIDRLQASRMFDVGASETAIEKGLMQNNPPKSMTIDSYIEQATALKKQRQLSPAPQQAALDLAQQRAALPVEQGGLGLPAGNTAEQRAGAMGFTQDAYHGTPIFPSGLGDILKFNPNASVEMARRKPSLDTVGSWFSDNPASAGMYEGGGYGAIYPVKINPGNVKETTFENMNRTAMRLAGESPKTGEYAKPNAVQAYKDWLDSNKINALSISHNPESPSTEFLNQVATVVRNPDDIRSRFAAFDPFRRSAAVAATMGAAAPDLLAAQQDEEMRKLQQLGLLGMVAP